MIRSMLLLMVLVFGLAACGRAPTLMVPSAPPPAADPDGRSTVNNGSDIAEEAQGAAWFLGDRTIRYCYEAGTKFGVPTASARMAIRRGFDAWRNYVGLKGINNPDVYDIRFNSREGRVIALNSEEMAACDGTEDLKFYLGVSTPLTEAVGKRYRAPAAFAHRTHYDPERGWGKGFIWVAEAFRYDGYPLWPSSHQGLATVITHELGHVFGCAHANGTIMDENIGDLVRYSKYRSTSEEVPPRDLDKYLVDIQPEHGRELVHCELCEGTPKYNGQIAVRLPVGSLMFSWMWDLLTAGVKFPLSGIMRTISHVSLISVPPQPKDVGGLTLMLQLDGVEKIRVERDPVEMFKVAYRKEGRWIRRSSHPEGVTYSGQLVDVFGEMFPAILSMNVAGHLFSLRYWDGKSMVKLLQMEYVSLRYQFLTRGE